MRTEKDISQDFYQLLRGSSLADFVSGGVYLNEGRPRDSRLEDIIVIFTTATAEQVQEGILTVNIYVPDIDPADNGVWIEDGARMMAIQRAAQDWLDGIDRSAIPMRLRQQENIYSMRDEAIRQHFAVMRIRFNYLNE